MVKLVIMQIDPFTNQSQSGFRSKVSLEDISAKIN